MYDARTGMSKAKPINAMGKVVIALGNKSSEVHMPKSNNETLSTRNKEIPCHFIQA